MTDMQAEVASTEFERVAALVAQSFRSLESRREHISRLRTEVPALEAAWSSVERGVLTLGRRRRTLEAPLPPLPEPRGGAAMQNWLEQRLVQGERSRGWVERLPAALALMRSVEAVGAFGYRYTLPEEQERRLEDLRVSMRQAILRQDLAAMDALLPQLQESLTKYGQYRTDLIRIVESRMAVVVPAVHAIGRQDAKDLSAVTRWQHTAGGHAANLIESVSLWDVLSARRAEVALNALADEVPAIRSSLEADVLKVTTDFAALGRTRSAHVTRLSELRPELAEGSLLNSAVKAGGSMIAALGLLGVGCGIVVASLVLGFGLLSRWYGFAGLFAPVVFGLLGVAMGLKVGASRVATRRTSAAAEVAKTERELARCDEALANLRSRIDSLRSVLAWFQVAG